MKIRQIVWFRKSGKLYEHYVFFGDQSYGHTKLCFIDNQLCGYTEFNYTIIQLYRIIFYVIQFVFNVRK